MLSLDNKTNLVGDVVVVVHVTVPLSWLMGWLAYSPPVRLVLGGQGGGALPRKLMDLALDYYHHYYYYCCCTRGSAVASSSSSS